ncbi:MoaD/ThiS family protein [Jiulongibacter sp. NS-SX5]|uniref:MoaD/ThiS family protein n=1 Tax=Jiulongibacter sp. NS-SX5 TaxID=3463854 RepID=UPI0040585763
MKIKVLCFGITRDILGGFEKEIELEEGASVEVLKQKLISDFPEFQKLNSLRIAVNEEYGNEEQIITEKDEIVLIPPVSGG